MSKLAIKFTTLQSIISQVLGAEPVPDARYLLAPISSAEWGDTGDTGPQTGTEFVADLVPTVPVSAAQIAQVLPPTVLIALGFPRLWWRDESGDWHRLSEAGEAEAHSPAFHAFAASWDLAALQTDGARAAQELAAHLSQLTTYLTPLGIMIQARETPAEAGSRVRSLVALRTRFGRPIVLRLVASGRMFPSRDVWRAVYGLGLVWGLQEQFHWPDIDSDTGGNTRFTISGLDTPASFLPERALEGEARAGLVLSFDLPREPDPLAVFDRMLIALYHLRERLGGRPTTHDGVELDAERVEALREALEATVQEMTRAGITPGSPSALRFF